MRCNRLLSICTIAGLLALYSVVSLASEEDYLTAISQHESNLDVLLEDCGVLREFQTQRSKLHDISSRTEVSAGAAKVCITMPDLNIGALQSLANILVGYGTGHIPAVGPIIDELASMLVDKGFDANRTKCYPVEEGQRIYAEVAADLAKLERPYQQLRDRVSERWWSIVRSEEKLEELAVSGPEGKMPERIAQLQHLSARKNSACPMF